MSEFNKGDRVRYEGGLPQFSDPDRIGKLGTVETTRISFRPSDKIVKVKWDDGLARGVFASNLRNLTRDTAVRDILTAFDVPAGFPSLSFGDYFTTKPIGFAPVPEPTLQETLRAGAEVAETNARALQAYASASTRLADSIDRLENLTK